MKIERKIDKTIATEIYIYKKKEYYGLCELVKAGRKEGNVEELIFLNKILKEIKRDEKYEESWMLSDYFFMIKERIKQIKSKK